MSFNLNKLLRQNIKNLVPYSSARAEFKGGDAVFLDANENSYGSPVEENFNRYPDPLQLKLKEKISDLKGLPVQNIFIGNGSDEAIDILFRAFCRPGKDNVIICPPTYGMYEVTANINDAEVKKVNLAPENFQLDTANILSAIDSRTRLIFVCCPNNPTGNGVKWSSIKTLLEKFKGIVVVDEAYINFASYSSLVPQLPDFPNLVILQTFSKAWGLAGLRIGMAFASEEIIDIFNKIKPPYNVNAASQKLALEALTRYDRINAWTKKIILQRKRLAAGLGKLSFVQKIYPSEANFLLVKMNDPQSVYDYLAKKKIIVRDRSRAALCRGCLRITVGTKKQNTELLNYLKRYKSQKNK